MLCTRLTWCIHALVLVPAAAKAPLRHRQIGSFEVDARLAAINVRMTASVTPCFQTDSHPFAVFPRSRHQLPLCGKVCTG